MSQKEVNQIKIFEDLVARRIKQLAAAKMLGLKSTRQVKRKLKAYRRDGAAGLVHQARGKPSNNRISADQKQQAIDLVRTKYPDFGPTMAVEKLAELDNLVIGRETLRQAMIEAGLWQTKPMRVKPIHVWRERRACAGELVQLDGSPHGWFEDRGERCTLLAFIDDATSRLLWLEFADLESTRALMVATEHYLLTYGRPLAFYTDRGGVYKVNLQNPDSELLTQYQRALQELDVKLIHARSPQAKGRVERVFETLQDRLVKELRLADIGDLKTANRFVQQVYLPRHNARFAVMPRDETDLHRSLAGYDLNHILCIKDNRTVTADHMVSYHGQWLQLEKTQPTIVRARNVIEVHESLAGKLSLWARNTQLSFHVSAKPAQRLTTPALPKLRLTWIPAPNHPWRYQNRSQSSLTQNPKGDISTLQEGDILTLR